MKKSKSETNEIDIGNILLDLWKERIKIIIIVFIFLLLGLFSVFRQIVLCNYSFEIREAKSSNFIKYIPYNEILRKRNLEPNHLGQNVLVTNNNQFEEYVIGSKYFLDKFIIEFQDSEELLSVLKNKNLIPENTSKSPISDKDLLTLLKSGISIERMDVGISNSDSNVYRIEFKFYKTDQIKRILDVWFQNTFIGLKKSVARDITSLAKSIDSNNNLNLESLELQLKNFENLRILDSRIDFLKTHSDIAKSLNIKSNQSKNSGSSVNNTIELLDSNLREYNDLYYLRGYELIDEEIRLIRDLGKNNLNYDWNVSNITQKISSIKADLSSQQLLRYLDVLENDDASEWVEYNLDNYNITKLSSKKNILIRYILVGFLFAFIYVKILKFKKKLNRKN